jgi:hypothetical protein
LLRQISRAFDNVSHMFLFVTGFCVERDC